MPSQSAFETYFANVNLGLRMLGAAEASRSEVRDHFNCACDTDEAAEAIVHYRALSRSGCAAAIVAERAR